MNDIVKIETAGRLNGQWRAYAATHQTRSNLAVHAATVPVFLAGTLAVLVAACAGLLWALAGVIAMATAMAAQGRTHRGERCQPAPFEGVADVVVRILAEQWVTFPRYVWSGAFFRAWQQGRR